LAALWSAPVVRLGRADWYRAIPSTLAVNKAVPPPKFTHGITTRFNAGDLQAVQHRFDTLYFAEDTRTCLYETGALLGTPLRSNWSIGNPGRRIIVVRFRLNAPRVIDLTDPALEPILGMTAQASTGDWEGYRHRQWAASTMLPIGIAPTQQLGRALYARFVERSDLDGFVALSARVPTRRVLVLFDPHDERGKERELLGSKRDRKQVPDSEILASPPAGERGEHD
jgi:hypothetical protein